MHNFIETPLCMGKERLRNPVHPTQKPLRVLHHLLKLGSKEGDLVFDPFMGVGSTGVAALNMGRRFLGFDQDSAYVGAAARRLREVCGVRVMPVKRGEPPPFLLIESPFPKSAAEQSLSIVT
jgi:site-specific DNA-methyltransferase (adenine-specific)/modification methylase